MSQPFRPRRRGRVGHAALRRIEHTRATLATRYAAAATPTERFAALAAAVRASAAPGAHQPDQDAVDRQIDALNEHLREVLTALMQTQQRHAENTVRNEERRRRRHDSSTRAPAAAEHHDATVAA